ncbi:hypothetical protein ACOMHN_029887 [Nucella lapillus]
MKASIASSRGRPPKLQQQTLTNKLLLQFELLRTECQKSWDEVLNFAEKIVNFNQPSLQGLNLKTEIEAVAKKGDRLSVDGPDVDDFLSSDVEKNMLVRNIGPHLGKHSIYRPYLLNPETLKTLTPPSELCNGVIHDLVLFLRAECLTLSGQKSREILEFLGVAVVDLTDKQLLSKLNKIMDKHTQLNKNTHREKGKRDINIFLASSPDFTTKRKALVVPQGNTKPNFSTEVGVKLAAAEQKAAALRRQLEDWQSKLTEEERKTAVLSEQSKEQQDKIAQLEQHICQAQQTMAALENDNRKLKEDGRRGQQQLQLMKQNLRQIRQSNFYKRLKRKEREHKTLEANLQAHMVGNCDKKNKQLKHQVKLLQTQVSNQKKKMQSLQDKTDLQTAQLQQQKLVS